MKFDLFEETFHVDDPISLIEAYCYQNDFYQHYDLLLNKSGNRTLCDTNKIGARISKKALKTCEPMLLNLKNIMIFKFTIEIFLFMNDRIRERYIKEMHDKIIIKMMAVEKIGLSRSTKILHTLYQ